MKKISLTQGKFALVDDEDYEYLNQFKWHCHGDYRNDNYYATRDIKSGDKWTSISIHRDIMKPPEDVLVDHRNRNGLDNRRENLRTCTKSQNGFNRKSQKGSSSKYLGVGWDAQFNKWRVRATINGKAKFIGLFKTELEAGIISNITMRRHYGEFARPNKLVKINEGF